MADGERREPRRPWRLSGPGASAKRKRAAGGSQSRPQHSSAVVTATENGEARRCSAAVRWDREKEEVQRMKQRRERRRKTSTARPPGASSVHAVFSKVEEGTVSVPFPQRTLPEDDHRGGAAACKIDQRCCRLGFRESFRKARTSEIQREVEGMERKGEGGGG